VNEPSLSTYFIYVFLSKQKPPIINGGDTADL